MRSEPWQAERMKLFFIAIGCVWVAAGLVIILLRNRMFREISRTKWPAAWQRPEGLLVMGLASVIPGHHLLQGPRRPVGGLPCSTRKC
jgi:hypothetical protein